MGEIGDVYRLSEEHDALRAAVRRLADEQIAPYAAAVDADAVSTCIVIEEVARACMNSSLIPGVNKLGTTPILLAADEELKKTVLPEIASGAAMCSYALSEREAGSDAAAMRTRARREGDHWLLNGTKAWITNAGVSTWYTVMAVTDPERGANGISAFAVRADDPGFEVGAKERKLGITGSPTCEIHLTDCAIPAERIIGAPGTGFKTALRTLDYTRPTIGAQAIGVGQGALDAAIDYVKQRKQFGRPVADFQGVQFMLADMAMKLEAARHLVYVAAARGDQGGPDLGFVSAAAKCFASDVAMQVTTDAVQLFGGAGYTKDFPVERMMRDAKITQIYEGTNQVQRLVMARSLLR